MDAGGFEELIEAYTLIESGNITRRCKELVDMDWLRSTNLHEVGQ